MKASEKIAKARSQANLTQDQLAELLNVSRQTISKWELDISLPETAKLQKLAKILAISIDYLLDDEAHGQSAKIPMKAGTSSYEPDWTALYPILKQYKKEVDCEHYYKIFDGIFNEIQSRYGYTPEDAMLVAKELMADAYFRQGK